MLLINRRGALGATVNNKPICQILNIGRSVTPMINNRTSLGIEGNRVESELILRRDPHPDHQLV